jgi:hypothetical protein
VFVKIKTFSGESEISWSRSFAFKRCSEHFHLRSGTERLLDFSRRGVLRPQNDEFDI